MNHRILFVCVGACALSLVGCRESQDCEKARLALAKTWHGLTEAAARRQLAGVDIEGWKYAQERAALLESSFMTTQVTWDSADKARKELATRVPNLQSDAPANVTGYRLSLDAALKEQDAYAQKCR
ncbi:MAG: hypothetical protein ACOY0T_24455 [Myxococcota bacterium]